MRIVVGITGATGVVYGIRFLRAMADLGVESHLVISRWAEATIAKETSYSLREVRELASAVYGRDDQGAAISSGSFRHDGMVIAPCTMKTLSAVRHGHSDTLIARAADVTLKERRRLVLMVRETPLSEIHLDNMLALSRMGAVVAPPVPAFYNDPQTIDDLVDHSVGRVLDLFDLELPQMRRWSGMRVAPTDGKRAARVPRIGG